MLVVLVALLALPVASAQAAAVEPPQIVAPGGKWISGDFLQQTGLNCSTAILGEPYTEVMVSGIASYGGLPSVPKVNDPYWTAFLVSIPGNPCGSGSANVVTTLILPPSTQVDSSRPIKCYGLPRVNDENTPWQDLGNQSWSFLGSSGPYCVNQPSISPYHGGGLQFGFRPLANGQMFWIFVPVKSSGPLIGAGGPSPGHGFTWLTDATGVYANPGRSFVWANVLDGALGANPFVYFAQEPASIPFWKEDAPNDPGHPTQPMTTKSRVEWLANLYSAGKTGNFCWELYKAASATGTPVIDACASGFPGWVSAITAAGDLWQVFGSGTAEGPNGGYSPLYYDDDPPSTTFTVRWKFIPSTGPPVFKDSTFTTLAGPDQDGDGIPNNGTDLCPAVKGTLTNGCLPAVQADPDKDGVYGALDLCPALDGQGAQNGCPGGIIPEIIKPPENKTLVATLLTKSGAVFKRASLAKGAPVKFECTVDSAANGTLSITKKVAKKLKIKTKKKQKTVGIASGKGQCKAVGGGSLKLKVLRAYAKKVKKAKKTFPASLAIKLTAPGQTAVTVKRSVKVR